MFEWDDLKNNGNFAKHGLSFNVVHDFAWYEAVLFDRSRPEDGEARFVAVGLLNGKLHTVVFTRRGKKIRIISVRRSNKAEEKTYGENI